MSQDKFIKLNSSFPWANSDSCSECGNLNRDYMADSWGKGNF